MSEQPNVSQLTNGNSLDTLRRGLLHWWNSCGRSFPWRETSDPYKILIAEILLHRTRAEQVVPLYEMLIKRFPDVRALAGSNENELLKLLYSAGLRWRVKMLHSMAVEIVNRYQGVIPQDFDELTSLPGISHYIASAIRCFSFGSPDVLLDTNTVRVTGRVFGLRITDNSRRSRQFTFVLKQLMDPVHPREFNWAVIDFASLICRSKSPLHEVCPIELCCSFYKQKAGNFQV